MLFFLFFFLSPFFMTFFFLPPSSFKLACTPCPEVKWLLARMCLEFKAAANTVYKIRTGTIDVKIHLKCSSHNRTVTA